MDSLSLPSFSKKVSSPASSENEMSLNPSHHYQISFPALSEHEISNVIPRFIGIRNIKCHSPVYRITERKKMSFPGFPDYGSSLKFSFLKCHSPCVGGRNVKSVIPSVSGPEMSPIKMSVSTNHQFANTFQIPQYNYQHGNGQSSSLVELQYPLVESGPFLQQIWVSLCSSSFKTNHLCHPTSIITSQAFITS